MRIKDFINKKRENLIFRAKSFGLFMNENESQLRALKDIHKGQSAVIIGMGPSLKIPDLDLLKGHITFACNKIYLAFDQTKWRPDYYSVCDVLVAENNKNIILNSDFGASKIIHSEVVSKELKGQKNAIFYKYNGSISNSKRYGKPFNPQPQFGILGGGYSVLIDQIQLAFFMGFSRVYLIGVDFSFDLGKITGEQSASGRIIKSKGEINHFHKDYRKKNETWTMPRMDEQKEAFKFCNEQFNKHGRELINASRTSKLNVLRKVDFEKTFFKA